jgi:2-polyprenyl-3-methyl-5-hydroxy-6-metoxy-1,4-benzoquinol methylase
MKIEYSWVPGGLINKEYVKEFSDLYSNHYGIWSEKSEINPGRNIFLSPERISRWLSSEDSKAATARIEGRLIGYAIAIQIKVPMYGVISWVTQFVVHKDFRNNDIGKTLLFSIWGLSSHYAWGLLSSSPYAIRALEKATRRRCEPKRIKMNYRKLINLGVSNVPYINRDIEVKIKKEVSIIDTKFFVDHSEVGEMIKNVTDNETPWLLGSLEEGWEWFAFTFKDQKQIDLTSDEIEKMIDASDQVTNQAYSRMQLSPSHRWTQHTEKEAELIEKYCNLKQKDSILDLGCGNGRHLFALAKNGFRVCGVDYVESLIDFIKNKTIQLPDYNIRYINGDCRTIRLSEEFDAVICLYDVIGTYVDNSENLKVMENIVRHLKPGGRALISVMNYELTKSIAKHFFSLKMQPYKLLELPASDAMEKTGNVFNPDNYAIDNDTCVVYRREQFTIGNLLPTELVVRDRRFRMKEIEEMCQEVGLNVLWSRFVNAGNWKKSFSSCDNKAKEILLLCQKSRNDDQR